MPENVLIHDATIVTMDKENEQNIIRGNIHISNGWITNISPPGSAESCPDVANINNTYLIDGTDLIIMPGMVNTHGHSSMSLFRGYADDLPLMKWLKKRIWPLEFKLTPKDIYWGTMLSIVEMIRSGTTTFADMYFNMDQVATAVQESGMRAVLSQSMAGVIGMKTISYRATRSLIENWQGAANGRIKIILGPHAVYTCPPDYLKKVLRLADKKDIPIQIHVSETRREVDNCLYKHGLTPVELLESLGLFERQVLCAHCVHLTDEDIQLLAQKNIGVAHNPTSNLKLGAGIAPVAKMLEAGIGLGLGTDGAASNNNLDMFQEMHLATLLPKGNGENPSLMPAQVALEMGTFRGAEILFWDDVGKVKPGYRADLIGINKSLPHLTPLHQVESHLVYSASGADVELSIIDGNILMEKGKLLTVDEEKIMYEADACASRLTGHKITI